LSSAHSEASPDFSLERWLASHTDAVALVFLALGLIARLRAARSAVWLPDEIYHLQIAGAPGLLAMYRMSLGNAHPPLFMLLLRGWLRLASTPWSLRLLPVAFGTAFLWAAYRWARGLFGNAAALIVLALLGFLPSLVIVSAELRGYSLMLVLIAAGLASLEHALETKSLRWLGLFGLLSALALLTHYAALWFVLAAFVYGSIRIVRSSATPRWISAWLACQTAIGVLFLVLYVSHIARLQGSAIEREARDGWLRASYFRAGAESPLVFLGRQTLSLLQFLFSTPAAAIVALALLLGGLASLTFHRQPSGILLALPFAFAGAAGLLGLYPYGGTRHSIELGLSACALVGVALARISGERLWVAILLGAALAPAGFAVGW
jgi:dolichyl-phosphate-mannose-protein mannosyltransferase